MHFPVTYAVGALAFVVYMIREWWVRRRRLPLPPGPKPWPIIENILDMPKPGMREWPHWAKHRAIYGTSFDNYTFTGIWLHWHADTVKRPSQFC